MALELNVFHNKGTERSLAGSDTGYQLVALLELGLFLNETYGQ